MPHSVLFVDDDTHILSAFRRSFRGTFDITTVSNAVDALKLILEGRTFAVIVSDLCMPGVDGLRLLSEVRRKSPHTRRLMLSGNADVTTAVSANDHEAIDRFLTKPCSADRLATAIREAIDQYDRDQKARRQPLRLNWTTTNGETTRFIRPDRIKVGDVLAEDLRSAEGTLLLSRGEAVTPALLRHIQEARTAGRLTDPISVERGSQT